MGRLIGIARCEQKRTEMEVLEDAEVSERTGVAEDFRGKPGKSPGHCCVGRRRLHFRS